MKPPPDILVEFQYAPAGGLTCRWRFHCCRQQVAAGRNRQNDQRAEIADGGDTAAFIATFKGGFSQSNAACAADLDCWRRKMQ